MHHGLANAVVLTEVMRYNISKDSIREKYASLGAIFGVSNDAGKVIDAIEEWLKSIDINKKLSDLGVGNDKLEELEAYALEDPCCPLNPKKVERGDVVEILEKLI
jgi:alcohol dehydrogenase class IV